MDMVLVLDMVLCNLVISNLAVVKGVLEEDMEELYMVVREVPEELEVVDMEVMEDIHICQQSALALCSHLLLRVQY